MLVPLLSLCAVGFQSSEPQDGYTITTHLRLVQPYRLQDMNDEFQSAKLIGEKDGVGEFEITYRPFHVQHVGADPNWRQDDAAMVDYLKPMPAANWDEALRSRILSDLKSDGIDADKLDDKTLVEKVSRWALQRSSFNNQFGLWMVSFSGGKPAVPDHLKDGFATYEPKGVTFEDLMNREGLGKGMYLNRTHGACTSSAIYLTTILRAVGIPTRTILTVPACDPNDHAQVRLLTNAIRHHRTADAVRQGVGSGGFTNHVYNEVYVGKKWVRLNYDRLGQPIVDKFSCGLMTHIYTARDVSEIPFSTTWGPRYCYGEGPKLSSNNPYQLVSARDDLKPGTPFDNPPGEPRLTTVTIVKVAKRGDPSIPNGGPLPGDISAFLCIKEWISGQNYMQLRDFEADACSTFVLSAPGHPDITATLEGSNVSDERGGFQGFAVTLSAKPAPGVAYTIRPQNAGHANVWVVGPGVVWKD